MSFRFSRFACLWIRISRHLIVIALSMLDLYSSCISCISCILHGKRGTFRTPSNGTGLNSRVADTPDHP
ncbi:hypothetical protein LOK49_LG08G00641 [Camellia lanceoleosa]|uniref:Uncharacterized protein n=1 Tax=Camellia lanceoleosa TaxID=1840588 RepID=A0ACC0GQ39_9ERIC|nr:hypothetical protein LOK49_LG08G00641 [Camellia lanceoleosa]